MTFYVYILQSSTTAKFYCGQTDALNERLKRHNAGEVKSTKHGMPWTLIAVCTCSSRSESMSLEKTIKKRGIQRWLTEHKEFLI